MDQAFAVEIKQVREIIKFSDNITRPPGTPHYLRGVLNLRQVMVSVIDLRSLYGMPLQEPGELSRILIVERGEERYGLLVDGVEDIITVPDSQRYAAPRLMRNQGAAASLQNESAEVIDMEKDDGSRQSFSVFDCGSLIDKLARLLPP